MGIFGNIMAIKDVQKIKKGGTAKLSISQITGLITNMMDAKKNLTEQKFNEVYKLFSELEKCNTKRYMDMEGYCETAVSIIKRFDEIAPYVKYSGGNELEFSFLMDDVYKKDKLDNEVPFELTREDMQYIDNMIKSSNDIVGRPEAEEFMQVLHTYASFGKDECLKKFDILIDKLIHKDPASVFKLSFFNGVLNANGIVAEVEMKEINNNIINIFMNKNKNQ